jgi:hypothetical protein
VFEGGSSAPALTAGVSRTGMIGRTSVPVVVQCKAAVTTPPTPIRRLRRPHDDAGSGDTEALRGAPLEREETAGPGFEPLDGPGKAHEGLRDCENERRSRL